MKNKNLIIVLVVGLVVLVGGFLILSGNKKTEPVTEQAPIEDQISIMKPEEIGLTLSLSSGGKEVVLGVANTENMSSFDYELSYSSKGDIPRGAVGHIDIKTVGNPVTQKITLGTCSDVCHYDEDVSGIKLIIKVVKTDGATAQVEKSL